MAEYLAQRFVDLRRPCLASQAVSELRLNHVEGGLHVAALVIVLHEAFRVVRVEVEHLLKEVAILPVAARAVGLERDVRRGVILDRRL